VIFSLEFSFVFLEPHFLRSPQSNSPCYYQLTIDFATFD